MIAYVRKAAELNETGVKLPTRGKPGKKQPLKIPDYFSGALKKNTKARKTFENFSPSNQRDYLEWVVGAKRDATRKERLVTAIKWMAEGKPRNWKYMPQGR